MKHKLSLKDLKVQSFVTDIDQKTQGDLMGGQESIALCTTRTINVLECYSQMNYSACNTCGIACTSPRYCPVES
jgi:hypothetical protein